ncbi:MAG: thioredoxin [Clostridia bacterium]|nr:thioredoxin [Clostridia bacterium]
MTVLTKDNFAQETASGLVLIDFWATWCGPCRMQAPVLEQLASQAPNLKICKVDVDEQEELAVQFRVMSIPTLVFMKDGKPVRTEIGFHDLNTLKAAVDQLA